MTTTKSQTTTPSGADVDPLAALDRKIAEAEGRATFYNALSDAKQQQLEESALKELRSTRTAVAALLARNAEMEAERDALVGARDKVKSLKRELAELQASRSGNFEGYQSAIEWAEHELQAVIDRYGCSALARTPAKGDAS